MTAKKVWHSVYTDNSKGKYVPPKQKNSGISETVPNQEISIRKWIELTQQGQYVSVTNLMWGDDDDNDEPLPTIRDLTDIEKLKYNIDDLHEKAQAKEKGGTGEADTSPENTPEKQEGGKPNVE